MHYTKTVNSHNRYMYIDKWWSVFNIHNISPLFIYEHNPSDMWVSLKFCEVSALFSFSGLITLSWGLTPSRTCDSCIFLCTNRCLRLEYHLTQLLCGFLSSIESETEKSELLDGTAGVCGRIAGSGMVPGGGTFWKSCLGGSSPPPITPHPLFFSTDLSVIWQHWVLQLNFIGDLSHTILYMSFQPFLS